MATSKLERDWLSKVERRSDFHWSPLLNHLSQEDLASTVGRLNLITKHSGSIIYGQGEVAESLFILATGFARAFDRSEGSYRQVAVFEEGQFLGEEAFLAEDRQRCVTVTAASDCELLEIDMPTLRQILLEQHAVLEQLEGVFRCRPWVTSGSRVGA